MACRHVRGEVADRGLSPPLRDKCARQRGLACRTRPAPEKTDDEAPHLLRGSGLTRKEERRCQRAEQFSDSPYVDEQRPRT